MRWNQYVKIKKHPNQKIKRTVGTCAIILNSSVVLAGRQSAAYLYRCAAEIHEHHNGTARDLWKTYEQINNPILAISMAFAKGIIQIEEVPEYCRESVERMAETFEIFGEKGSTTK